MENVTTFKRSITTATDPEAQGSRHLVSTAVVFCYSCDGSAGPFAWSMFVKYKYKCR
ncbi:hypothetical protein COCMIDRAFT_92354 [Bipolaris oryzae ATCC 44560]|uniref:Uncharacterized protein n=1 Tax=Bipolaris oryzae ATCC 44560 TaxID=930090 RepID=W6ZA27_COCMI|nr:uncharacterized protein COCMIDRAFT_92354 [Bipolaris oryzae ATCC 44560]EUC46633.1 hypothetical protein COCMIDRAFT_92354 [Bipolaris oryzae ATCC 44560]